MTEETRHARQLLQTSKPADGEPDADRRTTPQSHFRKSVVLKT